MSCQRGNSFQLSNEQDTPKPHTLVEINLLPEEKRMRLNLARMVKRNPSANPSLLLDSNCTTTENLVVGYFALNGGGGAVSLAFARRQVSLPLQGFLVRTATCYWDNPECWKKGAGHLSSSSY